MFITSELCLFLLSINLYNKINMPNNNNTLMHGIRYWHSTAAYAIAEETSIPQDKDHWVYRWPQDLFKPTVIILLVINEDERIQRLQTRVSTQGTAQTNEERQLAIDENKRHRLHLSSFQLSVAWETLLRVCDWGWVGWCHHRAWRLPSRADGFTACPTGTCDVLTMHSDVHHNQSQTFNNYISCAGIITNLFWSRVCPPSRLQFIDDLLMEC